MPVAQGNLSLKLPVASNDVAAQNGGRLTATNAVTSVFPDISGLERTSGITGRFRKLFLKNEAGTGAVPLWYSDPALSYAAAKVYLENISASDDYFYVKAATPTGVQSGITDSGWSGTGYLEANVSATGTSCTIRCETNGATGEIFQIGGTVILSEYLNGTGNREFIVLSNVSWGVNSDANLATLTFTTTPLQYSYLRNALAADRTADIFSPTTIGYTLDAMTSGALIGARVRIKSGTGAGQIRRITGNTTTTITVNYSWATNPNGTSVYEVLKTYGCMCVSLGNVEASFNTVEALTDGNGDYVSTGNLKLFPIGTRDDSWTIYFTSTVDFTITGVYYGQIAGTFSTANPARPVSGASSHFELGIAGWTGTWTTGDTLTFNTVSASKAFWLKEIVPSTANPHLASSVDIGAAGDTV